MLCVQRDRAGFRVKFTRKARAEQRAVRRGKGLPEAAAEHNKRVKGDELARKRRANERKGK